MKKLTLILILACFSILLLATGCGGHEHEFSDWQTAEDKHVRTCTVDGCEEKEEGTHEYGAWESVGDKHERSCTANGCTAKESATHEYGAWQNAGDKHERSCTTEGCTAKESVDHNYSAWSNGGVNHERSCKTEGCTATESLSHDYEEWENEGENHVRRCKAVGCLATQKVSHEYGSWESVGDKHERYCTTIGCDAKESVEHEYSEWINCGTVHQRECLEGCGEEQAEPHNYSTDTTTINGTKYYYCLTEGCDALMEEHVHSLGKWQNKGSYHERSCVYEGCPIVEQNQHEYTAEYGVFATVDGQIKYVATCKYCKHVKQEMVIVDNVVMVTPQNVETVFANISNNQYLYFTSGTYGELEINNAVSGVVIGSDANATVECITIKADCSNIRFVDIKFNGAKIQSGLNLASAINGLTVYNCSFTKGSQICANTYEANANNTYLVANLIVENCYFNITTDDTSAVNVRKLKNFTMKGCHVEYTAYNVVQIGHAILEGNVSISENVFEQAYSRMLYFVTASVDTIYSINIYGNYFGANEHCNKNTGVYVNSGGEAPITIGVNYWESIPVYDGFYFTGNVTFDEQVQCPWDR